MALIQPPMYLQQGTYSARHDRLVTRAFVGSSGAIGSGLTVAQTTPSASMAVTVSDGTGFIEDTISTLQGVYTFVNDAPVTVPLDPSNQTNARIDRIIARIYDAAISGTDNLVAIERVTGSPGPSPVAPALPPSSIELARVTVPANATSISTANISTANRAFARLRPDLVNTVQIVTSTTRPVVTGQGQIIYETDTRNYMHYNGSAWNYLSGPGIAIPVDFSPSGNAYKPSTTQSAFEIVQLGNVYTARGSISNSTTFGSWTGTQIYHMGTIAAAHRPALTKMVLATNNTPSGAFTCQVYVNSTGEVAWQPLTSFAGSISANAMNIGIPDITWRKI